MADEFTPPTARCAPEESTARRLIAVPLRQACDDLKLGSIVGEAVLLRLRAADPKPPWSFSWCCDQLGLNPNAGQQAVQITLGAVPEDLPS